MECGELCVMIPGQQLMQLWLADSLDTQLMVYMLCTYSCKLCSLVPRHFCSSVCGALPLLH